MKFKLSELKDIIQKEYKHTLTKRGADTFDATYAEEPGEDDDTEGEAKPGDLVDHTLREDTFDKEIEDLKKNIKNDEEHIEDLKKDIEGNKEELDRAEKRKDAEDVLDETWGSKGHEKRRRHGHRAGEGPKGHYDDYMGTYGEDKDEESRTRPGEKDYTGHEDEHSHTDPGEEDYTWRKGGRRSKTDPGTRDMGSRKGDRSSTHPGQRDYRESYRPSVEELRQIIGEEMSVFINEDKSGEGKCPKSGCVKQVSDNWRVVSNKTGKLWPQKYDSKKDAEDALKAYHANK